MASTWMVRSGKGGDKVDDFIDKGVIAIGWTEIAKDISGLDHGTLVEIVRQTYPHYHPSAASNAAAMLHKIASVIHDGDRVVTYDSERRIYHLGRVAGPYKYLPNLIEGFQHTRRVKWEREVSRDVLAK